MPLPGTKSVEPMRSPTVSPWMSGSYSSSGRLNPTSFDLKRPVGDQGPGHGSLHGARPPVEERGRLQILIRREARRAAGALGNAGLAHGGGIAGDVRRARGGSCCCRKSGTRRRGCRSGQRSSCAPSRSAAACPVARCPTGVPIDGAVTLTAAGVGVVGLESSPQARVASAAPPTTVQVMCFQIRKILPPDERLVFACPGPTPAVRTAGSAQSSVSTWRAGESAVMPAR